MRDLRISAKLVGVIGVVVAMASITVGWLVFNGAEQALYDQTRSHLETERNSRARFISTYFRRLDEQLGISSRQLVTQIALRDAATDPRRLQTLFQPYAAGLIEAFGYSDVVLIGNDGHVVYASASARGVAGDVHAAPLRETGLAQAFDATKNASAGGVQFVDYQPYALFNGTPAAFAGVAVFDAADQQRLGVLVFQIPVDEISAIMTDAAGFGQSGEIYLMGPDLLMRTHSRFSDVPLALKQKITTEGGQRALAGESGTVEQDDYRDRRVIAAYAPIEIEGRRWAIVAKIDVDEALAPVRRFRSRLLMLLTIVGLVAGFVLWEGLRRIVLAPVAALAAGARRVAARDYTQPVGLIARDELGQLGQSFDGMMSSVGAQVDELKRARAAAERGRKLLEESEERLISAARGANLGLWDVNPHDGRIMVNEIFESQLAYPPLALRATGDKWSELRGGLNGWVEFIHPDDRERVSALIQQYLAGASDSYKAEHRVRAHDGSYKWILSVGSSVERDGDGKPLRINGVHIDVSEMKGLQLDLELRYEELQRLQGLRDGLVHMIVHDLRSPLTSVMGYIDLLRTETTASAEDRAHFTDVAYTSAAQMVEMIGSLLDVNRLEAGEMPVDRQRVNLCDVVTEGAASLGGLTVDRHVSQAAPDGAVMVDCDAALIRRVVGNLLGNALKFTPERGSITITVSRANGQPRVEVADTGPGIPEDFLPKVFDKFSQAGEGRKKKRYSTGLGLAFCKLAVEAHGGTIGVTSELGVGSRFWFQLPA